MQGRLHGHGPGRDDGDVGAREDGVGLPLDHDRARRAGRPVGERRQELVVEMRRPRDDELRGRHARRDDAGGAHQVRQERAQFVAPAARQQRDDRPRGIEALPAQERFPRLGRRRQLEQRMPDERDRDPRLLIEGASNGKITRTRFATRFKVFSRPRRQAQSCGLM